MSDTKKSYWEKEEFEDLVARGLIAMYENKIHPWYRKTNITSSRFNNECLELIRKTGCYFPPNDRIIDTQEIDLINDGLPNIAVCASNGNFFNVSDSYLTIFHLKKINSLPKPYQSEQKGIYYQNLILILRNNSPMEALRMYSVVNDSGVSHGAYRYDYIKKNFSTIRSVHIGDLFFLSKSENVCTRNRGNPVIWFHDHIIHGATWNLKTKHLLTLLLFVSQLNYSNSFPCSSRVVINRLYQYINSHLLLTGSTIHRPC